MHLIESINRRIPFRYWVLLISIILIVLLHHFMSLLLLTTIFAYLAMTLAKYIGRYSKLSHGLSVTIVYLIVMTALILGIKHGASTLIQQVDSMIHLAQHINWHKNGILNEIYKNGHQYTSFISTNQLINTGLSQLSHFGHIIYELILALLFSFIFSITYPKLRNWGKNFINSPFKMFFGEFYIISHRFITILGKLFEVQLIICVINTTLMISALAILQFPYLLGFSIMIFILGLVPVFGVIISLIPLTVTAFIIGDWHTALVIILWVAFIHLLESYFLHPHLMSQKTHMPILVILINLIIMERLLGAWGLIVGLPILTFLLDFFRIQKFND